MARRADRLTERPANRGWPSWRTRAGETPSTIRAGSAVSRGYRISYEEAGRGSPILLVPGFTMLAADWREIGYVQRLATSRRVITLDPLGHGLSDRPHEPAAYGWPEVAADIVAVMDEAGVDRAPIWGYSRGAALAAVAAIEHPDRVASLILGGEALTTRRSPDVPSWAEALTRGDWGPFFEQSPAEDLAYAEEVMDPRAFGAVIAAGRSWGHAIEVDRILAPSLVYCGGEDEPEMVRATADLLGVPLHVFDGLDHDGGFRAIDAIMPLAIAHLERSGP